MTQISSNTLVYEQIFNSLKSFFLEEINGDFVDDDEKIARYYEVLSKVYSNVGMPMTEYIPFIHGEPPFSTKINNFSTSLTSDINSITRQVDYLNAKVVNAFNLFFSEIQKEKAFLNRISSKSKILQMYTKSPSDDLVYFGDSFDNMDNFDISGIKSGLIPVVRNGSLTFPIKDIKKWTPYKISLLPSNGFPGNNHRVSRSDDENSDFGYKYDYIETPFVSSVSSIIDDTALTYFEYESINVKKPNSYYDNEFKYISDGNIASTVEVGGLYDWSEHSESDPLVLTFKLESRYPQLANAIDITPNFKSLSTVKVESIYAFDSDGNSENILKEPIFIGSSISPLNIEMSKNYFYNSATIRFTERPVSYFIVEVSQSFYQDIIIQHVYWQPIETDIKTPFDGMERFNPDLLNQSQYLKVSFDKSKIIPSMGLANNIKVQPDNIITLQTYVTSAEREISGWAIKFNLTDVNETSKEVYFSGYRDYSGSQIIDFVDAEELSIINFSNIVYSSEQDALTAAEGIASWVQDVTNSFNGSNPYEILAGNGNRFIIDINENTFSAEQVFLTIPQTEKDYPVKLQMKKEILNAKRWSIGLADFSISHEIYNDEFEIVSSLYTFDNEVESVMLSVDATDDNTYANDLSFRYYISTGSNNWFEISPVELSFRGIAEVIAFNRKILEENKLPGVAYLNYPDVPDKVRALRVMIRCSKSTNKNITPVIRSYQLIAKVQKL
jgi:hypothetical protein